MSARGSQLEAGSLVGGYRIDYLISRGGMGMVYRATNLALNRIYALKVLAPELADDVQFRERFKREIRIAASLHHPNVVGIHYAGEHEGMLFLAMDLVDGTDLREVIVRSGALHPERAVELLAQITSALDAAHGKGLVHRDVKPANILISVKDGEEHAYLTDFGLAKRFDNATALTVKGDVVGTVDYMPPEQITGNRTDARSDIYALGCVLFQMLTGKVPYQREHSVATLFAHVYEPPPSLEGPIAASHPTLGPVIAKAMAKEPGERYLSAGDLTRDAVAALQGVRYTGAPTIVATGEARPKTSPSRRVGNERRPRSRPYRLRWSNPAAHQEADPGSGPATRTRASSESSASAEQQSASWLAEESGPETAASLSGPETAARHKAPDTSLREGGPETATRQGAGRRPPRPSGGVSRGVTGPNGRRGAASASCRIIPAEASMAGRCGLGARRRRGRRSDSRQLRLQLQAASSSPCRRAICDAAGPGAHQPRDGRRHGHRPPQQERRDGDHCHERAAEWRTARHAYSCWRPGNLSSGIGGALAQRSSVDQHDRRDCLLRSSRSVAHDRRGYESAKHRRLHPIPDGRKHPLHADDHGVANRRT